VKQVRRCTSLAVARHAAKYSCAQQSNKSLDCRHLPCNRGITTAVKRNKCLLPTTATISSKYSLTMTTVVYILLHLDGVLNELFSRSFIFFCCYQSLMTSSQTFKFIFLKTTFCHLYRCCTERLIYVCYNDLYAAMTVESSNAPRILPNRCKIAAELQ
jgi:hypothetical protein